MTLSVVLLASVVVASSCALHGAVGFGMNLVAVPFLAALDPSFLPGPAVAAGLVLSVLILLRERVRLDAQLWWAVLGLVPGDLLGVLLLAALPAGKVTLMAGCLVLVAVLLSLLRVDIEPTRTALTTAGTASGFLATAASIGGPPLALVYARSRGPVLRAQLSAFFVLTAASSLVVLALAGHFAGPELLTSARLLPAVVVGFVCSGPARRLVDRGGTRPVVLAVSALAALVAVVEGLMG